MEQSVLSANSPNAGSRALAFGGLLNFNGANDDLEQSDLSEEEVIGIENEEEVIDFETERNEICEASEAVDALADELQGDISAAREHGVEVGVVNPFIKNVAPVLSVDTTGAGDTGPRPPSTLGRIVDSVKNIARGAVEQSGFAFNGAEEEEQNPLFRRFSKRVRKKTSFFS